MFKIGDRVKCVDIENIINSDIKINCIYTIREINDYSFVLEEFERIFFKHRFINVDRKEKLKKILCLK